MTELNLFNLWLDQPFLVIGAYLVLLLLVWILRVKNIVIKKKVYSNHHKQPFYLINPKIRKIEEESSYNPPKSVIGLWLKQIFVILLLVIIRTSSIVYGVVLLRDISTIFLGLYFCRQGWSVLSLFEQNLLFKDVTDNPKDITGVVTLSSAYIYKQFRAGLVIPAILWLFLKFCMFRVTIIP